MASKNGFGSELDLIHKVATLGRKVGADRVFWKAFSQDEEMFRRVVDMVKKNNLKAKSPNAFKVLVDYRLSLAEMVKAGNYSYVRPDIKIEFFPFDARFPEEVEVSLFRNVRRASVGEVFAQLEEQGLRPANLPELLAVGACNYFRPWHGLEALGPMTQFQVGRVRVPYLTDYPGTGPALMWRCRGLSSRCQSYSYFLAVRK